MNVNLNKILAEKNMSQEDLANAIDEDPTAVSRIARNTTHQAYREKLEKICLALNITPNDLFSFGRQ